MTQLYSNNGDSQLAAAILLGDTSILLKTGDGALFNAPTGVNYELLTIENAGVIEIIKVTSRSTDALTVVRAQEGTTAADFPIDSTISGRLTAGTLASFGTFDPTIGPVEIGPNDAKVDLGGSSSIAIGDGVYCDATESTVIGQYGYTEGSMNICIGVSVDGAGDSNIAIGNEARIINSTDDSVAIGHSAWNQAAEGVCVGKSSRSIAAYATAIGSNSITDGEYGFSAGYFANAAGAAGICIGKFASSNSTDAIVMGNLAGTGGTVRTDPIAIGRSSKADNNQAIAIGKSADAGGIDSVALGVLANAPATNSISIGDTSLSSGSASTAIGQGAVSSGSASIAIGNSTASSGTNSVCLGPLANTTGNTSTAIGYNAKTTAGTSVAVGPGTIAHTNGIAIGAGAAATTADRGIAIGQGATVHNGRSMAVGAFSSVFMPQYVSSTSYIPINHHPFNWSQGGEYKYGNTGTTGYLVTDPIDLTGGSTWAATTAYTHGDVVKPTVTNNRQYTWYDGGFDIWGDPDLSGYTPASSGASEPTWPTGATTSVSDGGGDWITLDNTGYVLSLAADFMVEEVIFIAHKCSGITVQANISVGTTGNLTSIVNNQVTVGLTANKTVTKWIPAQPVIVPDIIVSMDTLATGTEMLGAFIFKGFYTKWGSDV